MKPTRSKNLFSRSMSRVSTGCGCGDCDAVNAATKYLMEATAKSDILNRTSIRFGDRVLVHHGSASLTGVVRYVGDLDSQYTNSKLYVGIKLDDPYGNHDGIVNGKRYFKCLPNHGMVVAIENVSILRNAHQVRRNITSCKSSKSTLNNQLSKFCEQNVEQLLDTEKPKSLRFSSNCCLSSHTLSTNNMTPGLCCNNGSQNRESNLSLLQSCGQFSVCPSSLMSSELSLFDDCSNSSCSSPPRLISPSNLPLPPTPYPGKTHQMMPRQHFYEKTIELRSHKLTEELLARRGACSRLIHLESPTSKEAIMPPTSIEKTASAYSRRLLSGVPINTTDNDPDDANPELLSKLMHQWGNNERAKKMTSTLQMLIEGRRIGQKQVAWQKKLDELQKLPSHSARISRIKQFQETLASYKDKITAQEALVRAKEREQGWKTMKRVEKLQAHINEYERKCSVLEKTIKNHCIASDASKVLELLSISKV